MIRPRGSLGSGDAGKKNEEKYSPESWDDGSGKISKTKKDERTVYSYVSQGNPSEKIGPCRLTSREARRHENYSELTDTINT